MKRMLTAAALATFGLAPAIGAACEYSGESSASASQPAQLVSVPVPAATKVPAPQVVKALAPKPAKQVVEKATASVPDQKLAAVTKD